MAAPKSNQGIYKITSPSNRVYVGQTLNFATRFNKYRLMHCQGQRRLYASFLKYGIGSHKFEVVEVCEETTMNERERYYQDLYEVLGPKGLNCKLTPCDQLKGRHSQEVKRKISMAHKGKKATEETRAKMRARVVSNETMERLRNAQLGKKLSESTKEKMRQRMLGNAYTKGVRPINVKQVVCTKTGEIYASAVDAAKAVGFKRTTLTAMLSGQNGNKTTLKYL
jgi:group I intron endonuclease